jgi:hypothetical protein
MREIRANRCESCLNVLEGLQCLRSKIPRGTDKLSAMDPELTRHVNDTTGADHLHHGRIPRWLVKSVGIYEAKIARQ